MDDLGKTDYFLGVLLFIDLLMALALPLKSLLGFCRKLCQNANI